MHFKRGVALDESRVDILYRFEGAEGLWVSVASWDFETQFNTSGIILVLR